MNNAAINIGVEIFPAPTFSYSGMIPRVELLDHMVILFNFFKVFFIILFNFFKYFFLSLLFLAVPSLRYCT